jgi:hypothetical protein
MLSSMLITVWLFSVLGVNQLRLGLLGGFLIALPFTWFIFNHTGNIYYSLGSGAAVWLIGVK